MRKICVFSVSGLALTLFSAIAIAYPINVRINGERVQFSGTGPQQIRGRVMVPLRGVLEQMGAFVDWDASSQTVFAHRGNTQIRLPIGSTTAFVNGRSVYLDVPAMVMGGSTMVPLRFVSESLGANVAWDNYSQTVNISTSGYAHATPSERYRYNDTYRNTEPSTRYNPTIPRTGNDVNANSDRYYNDRPYTQNDRYYNQTGRAHRTGARIVLNEGTVIPLRLDSALSSRTNRSGDRFTATVVSGSNDASLPSGTKVEGFVREATPSSGKDPGVLDVDFRRFIFPNADTASCQGSLISLESRNIKRDSSGHLTASANRGNDRLKWIGIGAAGGLIVGALTKQNTLASLLVGAGLGYLYDQVAGNKKAGDVSLGEGTQFGMRLDQPLAFNAIQ